MKTVDRAIGAAAAGALAIVAVLLVARPILQALSDLAREVTVPVSSIVGLLLLLIAVTVFQRMTKR